MKEKKIISNYQLAELSSRVINDTLKQRIPSIYQPYRLDHDPNVILQMDIFSNVDQINAIGTKLYKFQNKSRNIAYEDVCFEFVVCRGTTINSVTGKSSPVLGGHFFNDDQVWIVPNYKEMEVYTVYLPRVNFVGVFSRFYLDVLFSGEEIWKEVSGIQKVNTNGDRYCVFINYKKLTAAYLSCIIKITTGNQVIMKNFCNSLNLYGNAVDTKPMMSEREFEQRLKQTNSFQEPAFF